MGDKEKSSKHVFYAVELTIFSLVGWGWLAVREYLGNTPVLDVVGVISLIVCTVVNLSLALSVASPKAFAPCANALFTYCLALWVLYIYGLSESTRSTVEPLCCVDASGAQGHGYSIGRTQAAAFFGGLPMHQVPGTVTLAYLTVVVLVAGAQARTCTQSPRDWEVRGLGLSIACMVAVYHGVLMMNAPLCNDSKALGAVSTLFGIAADFLLVDFDWAMGVWYSLSRSPQRSEQQRRDHRLIRSTIQTVVVGYTLFFCLVVSLVLYKDLSVPLFTLFSVSLVVYLLNLASETLRLYGSARLGIKPWTPVDSKAKVKTQRWRLGQDMQIPSLWTRGASQESNGVSSQRLFMRRFPVFLQGQANRGGKSN